MLKLPRLETEQVSAYFDETTQFVYVIYKGKLTTEVTIRLYEWLGEASLIIDRKNIKGSIFDFSAVTDFDTRNLNTAQKESRRANTEIDFSHIPVALVVNTTLQEQMVTLSMKVTPEEHRKRVVKSEAEGLAFIAEWQEKYGNGLDG